MKMEAHSSSVENQFKQWGATIDKLVDKVETAGAHAKVDHLARIEEVRAKFRHAQDRMSEFRTLGSDKWEIFRSEFEDSIEKLFKK